ncbi:MAG: transglutaminase domain-containing protein [Oscillospiraceae bacterium]
MKKYKIGIAIVTILLVASVIFNAYIVFFNGNSMVWTTYLQNPNEIYAMESGILYNNLEFSEGKDITLTYDFTNSKYEELLSKYNVVDIAGNGSQFEKAKNLVNEFSARLKHKSNYDNHIEINALALLEYSLDNKSNGINCRNKAQILNEMCLALGIYSRKVWIMPYSIYDNDCHVVNEVWDTKLNKWVMFDITSNTYWVDENAIPLSILEIREKIAKQQFCTPVKTKDDLKDLNKLLENNYDTFLYIAKNVVYTKYLDTYSVGEEGTRYALISKNMDADNEYIISQNSIESSPM